MTLVENKRFEGIGSMESFFEKRASDFETLELASVKGDEDGAKLVVVGEHELIWTEHHKAYTTLVEEALGIPKFCEDNGCDEKELLASTEILVRENPDVQMFVDSLLSMANYDGFLKIAYSVKQKTHCFEPHLTVSPEACHGHGHSHGHGHGHGAKEKEDSSSHGHGHSHGHGNSHGHGVKEKEDSNGHGHGQKEKETTDHHSHK